MTMGFLVLVAFLILICSTVSGLSLCALALASYLLVAEVNMQLGFQGYLTIVLIVLSAPMIGLLSTKLIAVFLGKSIPNLGLLCSSLSLYLVLNSDFVPQLSTLLISLQGQGGSLLLNLKVLSVVVQCACLISFALCASCLFFELPLHWLKATKVTRADFALNGLRPLFLIFLGSVSFNLIVGLINEELRKITVF